MWSRRPSKFSVWIIIGIGIGTALGSAYDDYVLWIGIGLALGIVLGFYSMQRRKNR